jgi:hypothetical protein
MKHQLEQHFRKLDPEYAAGQKSFAELENKKAILKNNLFRISSAIKVIDEELRKDKWL